VEEGFWRVEVVELGSMVDNPDDSRLLDASEALKDCWEAITTVRIKI
jgi:hypothetical protein